MGAVDEPIDLPTLKQWQTTERREGEPLHLKIPLPATESGKYLRRCPDAACAPGKFLVDASVTRRPDGTARENPRLVCPYCGLDDDILRFTDPEDIRYAREQVEWAARRDLQAAIEDALRSCEFESSGSGMFRVSCKFTPAPPVPRPSEPEREDLLRNMTCGSCSANYGVWSLALFCPACGACALVDHQRREAELAMAVVDEAVLRAGERGGEYVHRQLSNAHEDVVSAMEVTCKAAYVYVAQKRLAAGQPPVSLDVANAFQSVARGRKMFAYLGVDPFGGLAASDLAWLGEAIQRRHVIAHNAGVIDGKYSNAVQGAVEGEVAQVTSADIRRFLAIIETVVVTLTSQLPELQEHERRDA